MVDFIAIAVEKLSNFSANHLCNRVRITQQVRSINSWTYPTSEIRRVYVLAI